MIFADSFVIVPQIYFLIQIAPVCSSLNYLSVFRQHASSEFVLFRKFIGLCFEHVGRFLKLDIVYVREMCVGEISTRNFQRFAAVLPDERVYGGK